MNPTALVPPVFIPAILVPRPFPSVSFAYDFSLSPYQIASLALYYANMSTNRTEREKKKKKWQKERNEKEKFIGNDVVVCMFQSDKGSRWICLWFAGLFYGYLS
jgi:hypothetical protein